MFRTTQTFQESLITEQTDNITEISYLTMFMGVTLKDPIHNKNSRSYIIKSPFTITAHGGLTGT